MSPDAWIAAARLERIGPRSTVALALAMYAGVVALRIVDPRVGDGNGFLFVVPVAVLAVGFGLRAALAGALLSFVLLLGWDLGERRRGISALGYADRATALLAVGAIVGAFVEHRHRLHAEICHEREAARSLLANAQANVAARTRELEQARSEALRLLARAAEYRDDSTWRHTERVGALAADIARRLGMADEQVEQLREAALLHDVGKIAIPDEILLKPASLTPSEQEVVRRHATLGAQLLLDSASPVLQMAASIAATHHECWDGSGYPSGLSGERIPLVGRIVAVADVYDALVHDRPYKPAWPERQAIVRIQHGAGSQFDPRVVAAFLATRRDAEGQGAKRAMPAGGPGALTRPA